MSCIVPHKPHENASSGHVCPNNANVCVELERVEEQVPNRDGSTYRGHICGERLEFVDNGAQEGAQVTEPPGARGDSQGNDVLCSKAQFGVQVVVAV